jgi:hypothetical protein
MDGDRKYKQSGYHESGNNNGGNGASQKPRQPQGPRPSIDITGPRLPRLVQTVTASRCYSCATTLPDGIDFKGTCPKCNAALHCCKQCSHFEPSTRFQCLKPIPVRIVGKDLVNECEMFSPRVTVARDMKQQPSSGSGFGFGASQMFDNGNRFHSQSGSGNSGGGGNSPRREQMPRHNDDGPRTAQDARAAFDNLFKKP